MKVVLFCGGEGMRIKEHAGPLPKPMVRIGYRPILWHVMKYYAHFGFRDFVLCLGHGAETIKDYFVHYDETVSNDFVLTGRGGVQLLGSDIHDWRIAFVDTGLHASIGERLVAVRSHLDPGATFLANYADGVTDAPLPALVRFHQEQQKVATFLGVHPNYTSHMVDVDADGTVTSVAPASDMGLRINGGFFVFDYRVFEYIRHGEDLPREPFRRMIAQGALGCYRHDGFWACMDTFKEKRMLEDIHNRGEAPWAVWNNVSTVRDNGAFRGDGGLDTLTASPSVVA